MSSPPVQSVTVILVKAIRSPSGDQLGQYSFSGLFVMSRSPVASAFTTKTSYKLLTPSARNASRMLSGDHAVFQDVSPGSLVAVERGLRCDP